MVTPMAQPRQTLQRTDTVCLYSFEMASTGLRDLGMEKARAMQAWLQRLWMNPMTGMWSRRYKTIYKCLTILDPLDPLVPQHSVVTLIADKTRHQSQWWRVRWQITSKTRSWKSLKGYKVYKGCAQCANFPFIQENAHCFRPVGFFGHVSGTQHHQIGWIRQCPALLSAGSSGSKDLIKPVMQFKKCNMDKVMTNGVRNNFSCTKREPIE